MKKRNHGFSLLLGACVLSFSSVAITACSGAGQLSLASVRLNYSKLTMQVGDTTQLRASVSPKEFMNAEATWISTDENVAVVKNTGYVFAVGEGECKIHVFIGGGHAICELKVEGDGGEIVTQPSLRLNVSSQTLALNGQFKLEYYVYPSDTTVTFSSDNSNIATVDQTGLVQARSAGTTRIQASGSNGKTASCVVIVSDQADIDDNPGGGEELGYTGKIIVGSPLLQIDFTKRILQQFNVQTKSSVTFEVIAWEEDKAAEQMISPADGPDVYPYASDQTLRLYQRKALGKIQDSNIPWITENMGEQAYSYATLSGINATVGYPFAADNGYMMFYDKRSISSPDEINTVDKLFAKATELKYEVDFALESGFYAAGVLNTFNNGQSLYKLTAKQQGYTATSNFASDAGVRAATVMKRMFDEPNIMGAASIPLSSQKILATITDASKVQAFKTALGDNYGVAPLPYVSEEDHTRLGVYLGYKFYGVNPSKGGGAEHLVVSNAVAKFLVSEYAQKERYKNSYTMPTLLRNSVSDVTWYDEAMAEPHIAALNQQKADNGVIPLTAVDVALWSQTENIMKDIKNATSPTEADIRAKLEELDMLLAK